MKVRILTAAETEFSEAAVFYEEINSGLGERFIDHITRTISYIEKHPFAGSLVEKRVRKLPLRKFPYSLFYFPSDDELVIIAVAHQKRRPGYWRARIDDLDRT